MSNLIQTTGELRHWLEEVVIILGLISSLSGFLAVKFRRIKNQLRGVLNKSDSPNEDLLKLAETANLKEAAREIKTILPG